MNLVQLSEKKWNCFSHPAKNHFLLFIVSISIPQNFQESIYRQIHVTSRPISMFSDFRGDNYNFDLRRTF